MRIKVTYIPVLFDESTWIRFSSANQTVLAIFQSLFQKYPEVRDDPPNITVRVNGKKLHPIKWGKPLNDGDKVLIIQEVGYEIIAAIGIGIWGVIGSYSWASLVILVINVASAIYSYCTAPSAPSTGGGLNSSPTYGWDGLQMQVRQGVPIPIVYGEHKISGHITGGK